VRIPKINANGDAHPPPGKMRPVDYRYESHPSHDH
jgi:hypothetical protein